MDEKAGGGDVRVYMGHGTEGYPGVDEPTRARGGQSDGAAGLDTDCLLMEEEGIWQKREWGPAWLKGHVRWGT